MGRSTSELGGAGPARPPPVAEEVPVDVGPDPCRHADAEANGEEVDEDDPDAGIEVDVYEGSSIKRKAGVLKRDANSVAHLLTHRYRNPFCESCVKAKMRHFRSRTGAFKREVKTFGDLVTFDFVTASGDHEVEGRYALIIRDIYIYIPGHQALLREEEDQAGVLGRWSRTDACVELKLNHDLSLPGRPRTIPLLREQISSSLTRLLLVLYMPVYPRATGCRPSPRCAI